MCNRQAGIIVASTVILSLLLVTTATLVYYYVFSQQKENTHRLQILSELPQYNNIDMNTCKCQHSEENCAKEIDFHILKIEKEEFCTQDKILCCKLKENLHGEKLLYKDKEKNDADGGEKATGKEIEKKKGLEVLFDKLSLSKKNYSRSCKCQNSEVKCGKQLYIPQALQLEMISVCPHPNILCCNNEDDLNIEKEILNTTYEKSSTGIQEDKHMFVSSEQEENNKLNESDLSLDSNVNQTLEILSKNINEDDESILTNSILEMHQNSNDEINEDSEVSMEENLLTKEIITDLPKTYLKHSEKTENDLSIDIVHVDSHINNFNSHQDIESQNVSTNFVQHLNHSVQLYDTKETLLDSAVSQINEKNITRNKEDIYYKDININEITNIDNYSRITDKYADLLIISGNNITNEEMEGKTNFSFLEEFNLYDIMDNLNMFKFNSTSGNILPMSEEGNFNSTSETLYTSDNSVNSKSKPLTDHLFYYSYLVAFLYVISCMVGYFIPVFSLIGISIMQFIIISFPRIIETRILDIISPVLKSVYGVLGLL